MNWDDIKLFLEVARSERLSIAAVTYYGVGLVGFIGKSLPLNTWGIDLIMLKALSIPVIAGCVWLTIRQVKKRT